MTDGNDLHQQTIDAFEGADYPIDSPTNLVHALPNGPGPTFGSGDFSMTAMEPNTRFGGGEFPCDSVEAFVDDVLGRLEDRDLRQTYRFSME